MIFFGNDILWKIVPGRANMFVTSRGQTHPSPRAIHILNSPSSVSSFFIFYLAFLSFILLALKAMPKCTLIACGLAESVL